MVNNSSLGSSIVATSPGLYVSGDVAIADLIASQVTAVLAANPGAKNAVLLWALTNDAGHAAQKDAIDNPGFTGAQLITSMDVDICTRLDNYLTALFAAGVMKTVVCTEPSAGSYYGALGTPTRDAYERVIAAANAHILALSDPRIIVADLANAPGIELTLHPTDYAPFEAYLLPFCQAALA